MALEEKSGSVTLIKITFLDILLIEENVGDQLNHWDSSCQDHECLYKISRQFTSLLRCFSVDQSGGLISRPADWCSHPESHTACVAAEKTEHHDKSYV